MSIDPIATALPVAPLAAALVGLLLPIRSRRIPAILAISGASIALVTAIAMVIRGPEEAHKGFTIADFGGLEVTVGTWADGTAGLVALAVAIVAVCVQVYSVAYLEDDERYAPYAAQISLFTSAMLLVVVAGDLIPLIIGWEIMGLCSYLLIGHDRKLPEAPGAAVKAFLVTRTGDVGFMLGVAILGTGAGSFRIPDILAYDGYSPTTLTAAGVLLLCGVAGKSAQFPLHTWLPDAMAGPTPISALIHAATMVAAGVYLVARLYPIFTGTALAVLAISASITMLLGAATAMAQQDVKKVLAWSTVSQLGYMTGALAVGGRGPALLHLLSHAGFKALLFLCSGALIHAVGSNLMTAMGGLRKPMPLTFITMTIGLAALVGVPPMAGFVSKDTILTAAHHATSAHVEAGAHTAAALAAGGTAPLWAAWLVWIVGLITTGLTGWYATRLWLRTFFGTSEAKHPHEPSWLMRAPLIVLAVPSVLFGLVALAPFIGDRLGMETPEPFEAEVLIPLTLATLGSFLSWYSWSRAHGADPAEKVPGRRVLVAAFGMDTVIDILVTRPVFSLSRIVKRADELLVDGAVMGTGRVTDLLGVVMGRAHSAALPRAVTAVLSGILLLAVAIAVGVEL